jgi:hypothetical protein
MSNIATELMRNSTDPRLGQAGLTTQSAPTQSNPAASTQNGNEVGTASSGKKPAPQTVATTAQAGLLTLADAPPPVTQRSEVTGLIVTKQEKQIRDQLLGFSS